MSTLSSASSITDIKNAYADNASYQEDGSAAKCAAFITACRLLLMKIPTLVSAGTGNQVQMETRLIAEEMRNAKAWLATSSDAATGGGVIFPSFDNLRGF